MQFSKSATSDVVGNSKLYAFIAAKSLERFACTQSPKYIEQRESAWKKF